MENTQSIKIRRDGKEYGPFSFDQTVEYLHSGNLALSDMAWDPKSETWISLGLMPAIKWAVGAQPPPPPVRSAQPAGRNIFKLMGMAFFWWIIFYNVPIFLICGLAGGIAGAQHPDNGYAAGAEAGRQIGQVIGLPVFLISLVLAIWLTVIGALPGTRK